MINIKTRSYLILLCIIGATSFCVFQKQQEILGIESYKDIMNEELDSIISLYHGYTSSIMSLEGPNFRMTHNSISEEVIDRLGPYKDIAPILYEKLVVEQQAVHNSYSLSNSLCLSHFDFVKSHTDSLYFGTSFSSSCQSGTKLHIDINGIDMTNLDFSETINIPLNDSITITTTKMSINDKQRIDTTSAKQLYIYQNSDWIESLP